MNSKDLGADLVFAWPQAEIGVMGGHSAVGIVHRRELAAAEDPAAEREALAAAYAGGPPQRRHRGGRGFVDEVIAPSETRLRLAWGLRAMASGREALGAD